jgi:hypothetical protein
MSRSRIRLLLCLGAVVAVDQVVQVAVLDDGYLGSCRIAPFAPPIFAPVQTDALERIRSHLATDDFDAELGWCSKAGDGGDAATYDWAGCRIGNKPLARERSPGVRRAVAIGCSFTVGDEVEAHDTWEAELERLVPHLEVANLGVGGYGLDQCLLRLRRDGTRLHPDEVWLGVLPSVMLRTVTTYPPALSHWDFPVCFKPRFELEPNGELRFVPSPARSLEDVVRLLSSQSDFLDAVGDSDRWVARAPAAYAPFGSSVLHRSSFARVALTLHEMRERSVAAELRDPATELFQLTLQLCRTARNDAERAGAHFKIWLLPDRRDLQDLDQNGSAYWTHWVEALRDDGIDVFELTEALRTAGGATAPRLWAPRTHYSAEGNRVVARALAEYVAGSRARRDS